MYNSTCQEQYKDLLNVDLRVVSCMKKKHWSTFMWDHVIHNSVHINRASTPCLFLRFVPILKDYVLENINVLISEKWPCFWHVSSFFSTILGIEIVSISSHAFCDCKIHLTTSCNCNKNLAAIGKYLFLLAMTLRNLRNLLKSKINFFQVNPCQQQTKAAAAEVNQLSRFFNTNIQSLPMTVHTFVQSHLSQFQHCIEALFHQNEDS